MAEEDEGATATAWEEEAFDKDGFLLPASSPPGLCRLELEEEEEEEELCAGEEEGDWFLTRDIVGGNEL